MESESGFCNWNEIPWISQKNQAVVQLKILATTNDGSLRSWIHLGETVEHSYLISDDRW